MKAYSYIRFSSAEQAKGSSYERQRAACEKYCNENNIELAAGADYIFFDKGKSAYKGDHVGDKGQLARFLSLVKDGTIPAGSTLIVESLDRLGREHVKLALPRFMDLLNAGIKVVTLMDGITYDQDYTEMELIMSIFTMSRAYRESKGKADRIGGAWQKKREMARDIGTPIGGAVPMWLQHVRAPGIADPKQAIRDGKYIERGNRYRVVERIFQMAVAGHGKVAIAKALNADGVESFKGGNWGTSSVDKVLKNKAVMGFYQPMHNGKEAGEPIPGYFPVVVEPELFYEAQEALAGRRISKGTRQTADFQIWQGIAKCHTCYAAMHLVNKGKPPKGYRYLRCANSGKGACKSKLVRYDLSELVFRKLLSKLDALPLVQESSGRLEQERREVEGRLGEQRGALARHTKAAETYDNPAIYGLIVRTDEEIKRLTVRLDEIATALATKKITDAREFELKVDLTSFEGRARANALVKRLGITVTVAGGETPSFIAINGMKEWKLEVPEDMREELGSDVIVQQVPNALLQIVIDRGEPVIVPLNADQKEVVARQESYGKNSKGIDEWLRQKYGLYRSTSVTEPTDQVNLDSRSN
nr:recombinase family protein [Massilia sp. YMA4]